MHVYTYKFISYILDKECVIVSDSDPDPVYWIQKLGLCEYDLHCLEELMDVTENVMNASQMVLKSQFKEIGGLLTIAHAQSLLCDKTPEDVLCVQILHTGNTQSNALNKSC